MKKTMKKSRKKSMTYVPAWKRKVRAYKRKLMYRDIKFAAEKRKKESERDEDPTAR